MDRQPLASSLLAALAASLTVGGCMVGPHYAEAPPTVSPVFAGAEPGSDRAPSSLPVSRTADLGAWWKIFGDPELDSLIDRALAANPDRQTAASRIREARQTERATRAGLFPTLNADPSASHTRISDNSGLSSIGSLLGGGSGSGSSTSAAGFPATEFDSYSLGLDASWDLDLFGGVRRQVASARDQTQAQVWSARDTDVVVISEVARLYLQTRADQARLKIAKDNAQSQADLLRLVQARAMGGLVNGADTDQQTGLLRSTQSQIPPLEAAIDADRHQLAIMLGAAPETLDSELAATPDPLGALPPVPPEVPVGLPSDLLKRRPDIRQAERQLAGSVENVGEATAALYPSVSLTASFSLLSTELKTLLDADSRNYNYGVSLTAPLFHGGQLRAQKHEREEEAIQAAVAYRKAVLTGLQQTADCLSRYAADQRQLAALRASYTASQRAAHLDRAQYLGGLADQQATLRDELTALQTQDQLVQAQGRLGTDLVALYRALGGGWETAPAPNAVPLPYHTAIR